MPEDPVTVFEYSSLEPFLEGWILTTKEGKRWLLFRDPQDSLWIAYELKKKVWYERIDELIRSIEVN